VPGGPDGEAACYVVNLYEIFKTNLVKHLVINSNPLKGVAPLGFILPRGAQRALSFVAGNKKRPIKLPLWGKRQ